MKKLLISLLILLSTASYSYAVTEFVVTVNKTGEDYGAISTAEAALDNAGNITDTSTKCGLWDNQVGSNIADNTAVTWDSGSSTGTLHHMTATQYMLSVSTGTLADDDTIDDGSSNTFDVNGTPDSCQITIELYDDDGTLSEGSVNISGFTTDSDNYVKITAPSSERHNGTEFSGAKVEITSTEFRSSDEYTVIEWLVVTTNQSSSSAREGLLQYVTGSSNTAFRNNIVFDAVVGGPGQFSAAIGAGTQTATGIQVYNNIIYGSEQDGMNCGFGTSISFHNNTTYNNGEQGIDVLHTNCSIGARNNASFNNSTSDYDSGNFDASATNASSDTTGTAGLQELTASDQFTNLTDGTEDFHLKSGSGLIDTGTDLGTGGDEIDIDGRDRDAEGDTWDIGADEFVAAAGGGGTGRTQVIFISKSGEIKSGQCWDESWPFPQEAGKCKSGRKWYLPGEFKRIN